MDLWGSVIEKTSLDAGPGRLSTVVVQRFCKPKVGGSNPSAGTIFPSGFPLICTVNHLRCFPYFVEIGAS